MTLVGEMKVCINSTDKVILHQSAIGLLKKTLLFIDGNSLSLHCDVKSYTPVRTHSISGLKSELLKLSFLA